MSLPATATTARAALRQAVRLSGAGASARYVSSATVPGVLRRSAIRGAPALAAQNALPRSCPQLSRCLTQSQSSQSQLAKPSAIQEGSGRDLVLSPPALVVTREYEWANILIGFEQANRYSIRAAPGGQVVGYLAEENSLGRTITRNLLRTHRPFRATVFDKDQNIIFVIRRPMYLISTSMFVETPEGEVLGEVHMNWHMWRRRYGLYVDKTQFASVDSGFLAIDFDMRDINGKKMASVNKDFTGFARELFTDARQYVLRLDPSFGLDNVGDLVADQTTVNVAHEEYSEMKVDHRERAVILATAIAIDFDYFSVHSRSHMHPGLMMMPGGGGGGAAPVPPPGAGAGGAGAAVGADVLSDAASPSSEGGETIDADPYGTPIGDESFSQSNADSSATENQSEWATFEEPDHGFQEPFPDDNTWSDDGDSWAGDGGEMDIGEEGGGVIETIRSIFNIFSDD